MDNRQVINLKQYRQQKRYKKYSIVIKPREYGLWGDVSFRDCLYVIFKYILQTIRNRYMESLSYHVMVEAGERSGCHVSRAGFDNPWWAFIYICKNWHLALYSCNMNRKFSRYVDDFNIFTVSSNYFGTMDRAFAVWSKKQVRNIYFKHEDMYVFYMCVDNKFDIKCKADECPELSFFELQIEYNIKTDAIRVCLQTMIAVNRSILDLTPHVIGYKYNMDRLGPIYDSDCKIFIESVCDHFEKELGLVGLSHEVLKAHAIGNVFGPRRQKVTSTDDLVYSIRTLIMRMQSFYVISK